MNISNKIIKHILPSCIKGDEPLIIQHKDKVDKRQNFKIIIPRYIAFEVRLMCDLLIYSSVYYVIILGFNPYIHNPMIQPDPYFLMLLMILSFFLSAIGGLIIKKRLFYRK